MPNLPVRSIEALLTPAEYAVASQRDLSQTLCVVFDVLRATSAMITALANGADSIVPVAEIPEAIAWKSKQPDVLLAGERHGLRIRAAQTGSVDFDLGNSPREFTAAAVGGRRIVTTTTNGTRALKACLKAQTVLVGALLNVAAVADEIRRRQPAHVLLVCSGTGEDAAYEDALAAGAVLDGLLPSIGTGAVGDAAHLTRQAWLAARVDPLQAIRTHARNGRRLAALPDLAADVAVCAAVDSVPILAAMDADGIIRRCGR